MSAACALFITSSACSPDLERREAAVTIRFEAVDPMVQTVSTTLEASGAVREILVPRGDEVRATVPVGPFGVTIVARDAGGMQVGNTIRTTYNAALGDNTFIVDLSQSEGPDEFSEPFSVSWTVPPDTLPLTTAITAEVDKVIADATSKFQAAPDRLEIIDIVLETSTNDPDSDLLQDLWATSVTVFVEGRGLTRSSVATTPTNDDNARVILSFPAFDVDAWLTTGGEISLTMDGDTEPTPPDAPLTLRATIDLRAQKTD